MALTDLQRPVCRLLAENRLASGESEPPDAAALGRTWHRVLAHASDTIAALPPSEVGTCVLDLSGGLLRASPSELTGALDAGRVTFHRGTIRGALPRLAGRAPWEPVVLDPP